MRSPLCLSSRFRRNPDSLAMAIALVLLAGCGGGDGIILPDEGEPAAIAVVEGDDQRGLVGEPLSNPLVVQVTDSRGRPVSGATVAFEFSSAGAGAGAVVVPEEKTTDGDGQAETTLVLGTTIGRQTGQARVVQTGTAPIQASFSAMALPENANTMAPVAGQDQTGHVGQALDDRLVVEVTDNFGNPVAGVQISWAAVGGGSVSAALVETDEDGRSRVERILGPAVGAQSAVASAEGLAGSPVTFTHTALAGDASRLTIISGNDQTAEAGTALPAELVVRLIDADGNGVPGTALSWVVATGGGSAAPEISTTDGEGRTSTRWTLGATLGGQRLDAVVSGVGIASFRATATAGAPASLFIRTQPSSTARNGVPLARQPVVQLHDGRGNDVATAGVEVAASLGGGGELGGTIRRSTDATGKATFDDLSISGAAGSRTLVFQAAGYARVTSSEIEVEATGTSTTITGDTPDPSVAGSGFTVSFQVTSGAGTPTGSVTVNAGPGSPTCSGPLSGGTGSCQLTLNNPGDRTLTATYTGGPGFSGSRDSEPHRVDPRGPNNEEPFADFNWNCENLTCFFRDNSRDQNGNGTIVSRVWDLGDGTTIRDQVVFDHTYGSAGSYIVVLTATDNGGLSDESRDTLVVTAPPPQVLQIDRQPSENATIGAAFGRQPRIQLRAGGDNVRRPGVTVTAAIASGGGTLGGNPTATTNGDGQAEFGNLSISGATGSHTLTFSAEGFGSVTSNSIEVRKVASETRIIFHEPEPAIPAQIVTVRFTVTGSGATPTGTVTVGGENVAQSCTIALTNGAGSCDISFTAPADDGDNQITADYSGDGRFDVSNDDVTHDVNSAPPANRAPTAVADAASTSAGTDVSINVLSNDNDPDGDNLTVVIVDIPTTGSVALNPDATTITYTPAPDFLGTDSFTYQANDGTASSAPATVTVTVE